MKLHNLTIKINGISKRVITFKDGLNIVTNKKGYGRSGNSVGKSTLSRIVDYLFLASISPIYIDDEFHKANEQIEKIILNSIVEAELSFIGMDNNIHQISRNLCTNPDDSVFYVDGEKIGKKVYESSLQKLFFDIDTRRPSVRFLAPKFIRNESHRMLNTTKFLDKRQGSKDYSELFLYILGFQKTTLLTEKRDATNLITRRKRNSKSLNAIVKEQKPSSLIKELKKEIEILEKDFFKFEYSPEYSDPIGQLSILQEQENKCSNNILKVDRKIKNLNKTIESLSNEGGNYLCKELKGIYNFAGVAIESGIREYEDVLSFHDNLVAKKRQFLEIDIPSLENTKSNYTLELNTIHSNKIKIFSEMRSTEHIEKITASLKKLGHLKESLGKVEGLVFQQKKANSDLFTAESDLEKILIEIEKEISNVELFEKTINIELKKITKLVHAEEYSFNLNFNKKDGVCAPEIINISPNPEGGKKKAEVIAFDLSYIHAINKTSIKRPNFVFHDSIEDIDQKQIDVLFELSRKIPGQQIVSMLSENMSDEMYEKYKEDVVLFLSEDDMFFKV